MPRIKLSPPWDILYDEINAMFELDDEVTVVLDEENYTISVFVNNPCKAKAIAKILEQERELGNITVKVQVPPPDEITEEFKDMVDVYKTAFDGNPRLSYVKPKTTMFDTSFYVVFRNEVIQYFNDNISDVNGNCSTLAEYIARDIFVGKELPNFCTDLPEYCMECPY